MDASKALMAAGESGPCMLVPARWATHQSSFVFKWDTPAQLTQPQALLDPLSLFVESALSSAADPRGDPGKHFPVGNLFH